MNVANGPGRTYLPKERLTRLAEIFRAGDARAERPVFILSNYILPIAAVLQ